MDTSPKTSANMNAISNISGNASSSTDNGDVYEFKSSKEPTPVRGTSSSPNPNLDKDKDSKSSNNQGGQNISSNVSTACMSISSETMTIPLTSDEISTVLTSPSSKRIFEGENMEEQDEENRRKKRKDSETVKENAKNNTTGRQNTNRNVTGSGEKVRNKIKKSKAVIIMLSIL